MGLATKLYHRWCRRNGFVGRRDCRLLSPKAKRPNCRHWQRGYRSNQRYATLLSLRCSSIWSTRWTCRVEMCSGASSNFAVNLEPSNSTPEAIGSKRFSSRSSTSIVKTNLSPAVKFLMLTVKLNPSGERVIDSISLATILGYWPPSNLKPCDWLPTGHARAIVEKPCRRA